MLLFSRLLRLLLLLSVLSWSCAEQAQQPQQEQAPDDTHDQSGCSWNPVAMAAAVGAAVGPIATSISLSAAGFTSGGVAAGSAAAAIQSGVGIVQAGTWFATAQSVAATGIMAAGAGTVGVMMAGGAVVGAGGYYAAPYVIDGAQGAYEYTKSVFQGESEAHTSDVKQDQTVIDEVKHPHD